MKIEVVKFIVHDLSCEEFMIHYKPREVHSFTCPDFGNNWSCPPHDFSAESYFSSYPTVSVIAVKVDLSSQEGKDEALTYFKDCRKRINRNLLKYESNHPGMTALIAGKCEICDVCTRMEGRACLFPEKRRFSFESLGFKVSDIILQVANDHLQWIKGQVPGSLYAVAGILTPSGSDPEELKVALLS